MTTSDYNTRKQAAMKTMQLRDAKAGLSALVDAAENGEPTIITRHGKAAAMVVPIEQGKRLYADENRRFIEHLLSFPGGIELERNDSQLRDFEF